MKKILITTDSFLPRYDGVAKFLSEIIPRLSKYYKITIIAPNYGRYNIKNAKIYKFPLYKVKVGGYRPAKINLKLIKKLVEDNDLVFNNTIGPIGSASIFYASKIKKPILSYVHSIEWILFNESISLPNFFRKYTKFTTKKLAGILYNRCNTLMVPSIEVANLLKRNGIKTNKVVIKHGIGKEFKIGNTKKKFKLDDHVVIGYCGRLSREKNLETLLKAFNKLKYKKKFLLIVGDGPYRNIFFGKNVKVTGFIKNVVPYLQCMDIFVLPSLTETGGLSALEAMKCGKVVVSTKVGYLKKYIKNGYNGYLFPKRNVNFLVKLLTKLVKDKKLRDKIGRNASNAVTNLTWDKTFRNLKKIIESYINIK